MVSSTHSIGLHPVRYTPQQTHKETWLTTASRTVVSVGRSDPLSANNALITQLRIQN